MMRIFAIVAASQILALPAQANMAATQVVEKEVIVVDKNGAEKIVRKPAVRVKPGEQVIYTLKFNNAEAKAAEGVVLVMPVPRDVTYVEGSITGASANVTFSADGGETYVARGRLTVTQNGEARAATNGDITHIKWTLGVPVAPKGAGEVSFRGVLK
jgi:uncharacterized repeat protein (TIGR01451 family)